MAVPRRIHYASRMLAYRSVLWLACGLSLAACTDSSIATDGSGNGSGEVTETNAGTTEAPGNSASDTGPGTPDDSTGPNDGTTTLGTTDPGDTTAGPEACDADAAVECPLDVCTRQWEFSCDCKGGEVSDPTCFAIGTGCVRPRLVCNDLPMPCPRVWGMGWNAIEAFEDLDAATCLLQSLRDGAPGRYELLFGDMGDTGLVYVELFTSGDGTLRMQFQDTCKGCPTSGYFGHSGTLELQDSAYFDACLADPTVESLADCLVGLPMYDAGGPPPEGWTPPFTTGTCVDFEWSCPEAP